VIKPTRSHGDPDMFANVPQIIRQFKRLWAYELDLKQAYSK
jgi:hypothetical protein